MVKLRNQVQQLKKELAKLPLPKGKNHLYSINDWKYEEILSVVFPEDGECFSPRNEELLLKWNQTDWNGSEYLRLFSYDGLKELEKWLIEKE